jgi:hypothetical protein
MTDPNLNLHAGEIVEVRTEKEILETLNQDGTLEGMPFMPEMHIYCGKKFRVYKRTNTVCVEGAYLRRMKNAVILEDVLCDGSAHDGCKRLCFIFWKEAWLTRVPPGEKPDTPPVPNSIYETWSGGPIDKEKVYNCQSTCLKDATEYLSGWDVSQYIKPVTSRSFTLFQMLKALYITLYNRIKRSTGGPEYGAALGEGTKTPAVSLNLKPGELVEVKSREEIIATLDLQGRNRGLRMDHEMLRHGGRQYRVLTQVNRIILETTGKMREIQNTVILDQVTCEGLCRRACARSSYPLWREAWLKRVD